MKRLGFSFLLLLVLVACSKTGGRVGDAVSFRASSPGVSTRTAYEGTVTDGVERINWVAGEDVIRISSPETAEKTADYRVIDVWNESATKSRGKLEQGDSPLTWAEDAVHHFYGMYPSPRMFTESDMRAAFDISAERTSFRIPAVQTVTPAAGKPLTYLPDMRYAVMLAVASGDPAVGEIVLPFYPMFDAMTISISAGDNDEIHLTSCELYEGGEHGNAAGLYYTTPVVEGEPNEDYPLDAKQYLIEEGTETQTVTVDFTTLEGGSLVLTRDGGPATFTIFAGPENLDSVTLWFTTEETGRVKLDLKQNGTFMKFKRCQKYFLSGMSFPKYESGTATGSEIDWNGTVGEDLYWQGAEGEDINWRN